MDALFKTLPNSKSTSLWKGMKYSGHYKIQKNLVLQAETATCRRSDDEFIYTDMIAEVMAIKWSTFLTY
jgi:hypothetical protein